MKIAHLADVHLGFRQYHRHTPSGVNQREADVANAFRSAVDTMLVDQPEVVIIAGDFFHSVRPTNQAIIFAFQQLQRIRQALPDTRVVLVAGNHDTPRSRETGGIITLFQELEVEVVAAEARRLEFPEFDLSILAVPYAGWLDEGRPHLAPAGDARHQVLTIHAEIEGAFPSDSSRPDYGAALVAPTDITPADWAYVALGHYHVQSQLAPNMWYSGALEYTSTNPWGELRDEAVRGLGGKGWLLVDLETGNVSHRPVPAARTVLDLPPIEGKDLSAAELDRLIADRMHTLADGPQDKILRLVIRDVPRHVGRDLDHTAIRHYKAEALHFHLDLRRPESRRTIGVGGPGTRQSLPDVVAEYLARRPLPDEVDREAFVRLGTELVASVPEGPTED